MRGAGANVLEMKLRGAQQGDLVNVCVSRSEAVCVVVACHARARGIVVGPALLFGFLPVPCNCR